MRFGGFLPDGVSEEDHYRWKWIHESAKKIYDPVYYPKSYDKLVTFLEEIYGTEELVLPTVPEWEKKFPYGCF